MQRAAEPGPWREELTEVTRAASGGLLFGVPLLYTMEVWWTGSHTSAAQVLAVLLLLMVPVLVLNRTGGFRSQRDLRMLDAMADTVETVAIGIVVTTVVLVMLREVTADTPAGTALGKVIYESVPFCLGVGVARHFLAQGRDTDDDSDDSEGDDNSDGGDGSDADGESGSAAAPSLAGRGSFDGTIADLGATTIGAVFVALSIAPTDEVPMIAAAMDPTWLLILMGVSLLASYAIVFAAGFSRQDQRHAQQGVLQRPLTETVACYLIALLVAVLLLWVFQRGLTPWTDLLRRVVVLGFPAAVGGAAGRLAL